MVGSIDPNQPDRSIRCLSIEEGVTMEIDVDEARLRVEGREDVETRRCRGAESWQGGGLIATDHCCGGAHTAESGQAHTAKRAGRGQDERQRLIDPIGGISQSLVNVSNAERGLSDWSLRLYLVICDCHHLFVPDFIQI
ncbi:hypothetical protein YC2023_037771 [Brassica napus]